MKIGKKYRCKKEKEKEKKKEKGEEIKKEKEEGKEKENQAECGVKNEERNTRPGPVKSIKKSSSFSFVTLFALSGKKKRKKINGKNKENNAIKEEEKIQK